MTPDPMNGSDAINDSAGPGARQAELVEELIAALVAQDGPLPAPVEAALRAVPRHLFVPGVSMETAYANESVVTKRDETGTSISSVSAPRIIAMMLKQAQVEPGHRVLEIGSGGYNAALLAELVGEEGEITSIDIDADVIARAEVCLAAAGYERVRVLRADGELGVPENAPYDRVIVTVGAYDIPPAWVDQLTDDGRLVVPLRMRGLTRSVAFAREGSCLRSLSYELCGFVPMQGLGENRERLVTLDDRVAVRVDDGQPIDADALASVLEQPRAEAWSGVGIGGAERFDGLDLWLACTLPGFGILVTEQAAIDAGSVLPALPWGASAVIDGGTLAYLTIRPSSASTTSSASGTESDCNGSGGSRYEFGAYAHGPRAQRLAARVVEQIRGWDGTHLDARIDTDPAGSPAELGNGSLVIDKRHTRVTISWPTRQRNLER